MLTGWTCPRCKLVWGSHIDSCTCGPASSPTPAIDKAVEALDAVIDACTYGDDEFSVSMGDLRRAIEKCHEALSALRQPGDG